MKRLHLAAVVINEPAQTEISAIKQEMKSRFKAEHALNLPAHITLIPPFRLEESLTAELMATMKAGIASIQPFQIRLYGCGTFKNPRNKVLFIQVGDDERLFELQQNLFQLLKAFHQIKMNRPFRPHVTVAHRDLASDQFNQAREWLENRHIDLTTTIDSVNLFIHDGRRWLPETSLNLSYN